MNFCRISKADNETLKLFIPYRKNFIHSNKSAIKQLNKIIKGSIAFYKVYHETGEFKGCLFVDCINEKEKIVEFGGFADRHARTQQAIRELMAFLKVHYPEHKIKAITSHLTAKISLKNAGLKTTEIKGEYYYG